MRNLYEMRWLIYSKQVCLSYWYYIIHDKQNKKGKIEQDICRYTQTGVPDIWRTRQGRRRSRAATTDHGSGPPRTGPEPPRAGPGPLQVEAGSPGGLSHRASQGTRTQHPIWVGVRSPRKPLWARPPTPGSGAATCPTGPASGPPLPAWAGVRNRHVPLWARPPTLGSGAATCPTGTSLLPEASPPTALNAGGWGCAARVGHRIPAHGLDRHDMTTR